MRIPGLGQWVYDGNGVDVGDPWIKLQGKTQEEQKEHSQKLWETYQDLYSTWHQLSGTFLMVKQMFDGCPTFLMLLA